MMVKKIFTLVLLFHSSVYAKAFDTRFFANREFQNRFPGAFALQPESQDFVGKSLPLTIHEGNKLIRTIQRFPGLASAVLQFSKFKDSEKIQIMKQIFYIQTHVSGFRPPELVLDSSAQKSAFFDFNPNIPGPGKVILNPAKLFKNSNPHAALLFLIHETRHSQQFQLASSPSQGLLKASSQAYKAAFTAQKHIFDQSLKASYCDFLTLNNEYEAFLFGNYVMETLTSGAVETHDMGTWASQYVFGRGLKIHLPSLALKVGAQKLLEAFNQLEMIQYKEVMGGGSL